MGGFDLIKTFQQGGWAMWPLLIFSIVALMFTLERIFVILLQKAKLNPEAFLDAFDKSMKKNEGNKDAVVNEMQQLCNKKGGVCADIMKEGLQKYTQSRSLGLSVLQLKQWLTGAIEERSRIELPQLESHFVYLSIVGAVAPLMGLLGTVSGMIKSFSVMASAAGGAKPAELAGGISEALTTTATGLIIAVPTLIAYNLLRSWVENYVMLVEEAGTHLVDTLIIDTQSHNQE
jgi:biopolymer transport protein ExbB